MSTRLKPRLKAYLKFFWLSLSEQLPHTRHKPMITWLWRIAFFIIGFIVADYLGIPLKRLITPIYELLPGFGWIIIGLSLVIVFLLIVIEGSRRYHQRIVGELFVNHLKIARRIQLLSDVAGLATQIERLYYDKEDEAPREIFEHWLGSLRTALQDSFGHRQYLSSRTAIQKT
jgi:hypothetical protein